MGFYEREIGFYREFAADCPVRKPRCYFGEVEMDSGASLLLLEDRHHPGKGHLSRQHCEGSRLKADKLLIKTRPEGQVGVGHSRDVSNARHTRPASSVLESHIMWPAPACRTAQSGHHHTHSVLVGARCQGACGSQKKMSMSASTATCFQSRIFGP